MFQKVTVQITGRGFNLPSQLKPFAHAVASAGKLKRYLCGSSLTVSLTETELVLLAEWALRFPSKKLLRYHALEGFLYLATKEYGHL